MKKLLFASMFSISAVVAFAQGEDTPFSDLPPTSEYGKCYAKCKIADQYETVDVQKLVAPEKTTTKTIPARYETVTERVMVKEASEKLVPVAPVYESVTEQVLIQPEKVVTKTIPAKYRTETRQVLVSEARGQWVKKKKSPNCFSSNPEDCYVACWEEIPAQYRTEKYQVLDTPESTDSHTIPAKYETVTKRVVKTPATVERVPVEAEYKTITKRVMVEPERTETATVPAQYSTVKERRLIRAGGYTTWTEILCAEKTTNDVVRRLQAALNSAGYQAGTPDGVMGVRTQTALKQYQTDKGLPVGNMNLETLRSLGIE
jgi:hypothetical protein